MEDEEGAPSQQKRIRKALMDQYKRLQMEAQKKEIVKKFMEPAAYERLMNIRASNPELYSQLVDLIISLAQGNRLKGRLTEAQLVSILEKVTYRPETKIEFKHK
ncbi:MAG: DNA-binding protein [Candidatus Marsarchaeota archaeon]|nr:DNA-binding protein [Candidatus Marsarchaeota archaeon]